MIRVFLKFTDFIVAERGAVKKSRHCGVGGVWGTHVQYLDPIILGSNSVCVCGGGGEAQ